MAWVALPGKVFLTQGRARKTPPRNRVRVTQLLNAIHALVPQFSGKIELLSAVNDLLVEQGGFVGGGFYFLDAAKDTLSLRVVRLIDAACGDFRFPLEFSLDPDSSDAVSPAVRVYRDGVPLVVSDLRTRDREPGDLKGIAKDGTLRSLSNGAYPLFRDGKVTGVCAFVWQEKDFFTQEISHLLLETAQVISLAFDRIDSRTLFEESEERLRILIEHLPEAVFLKDGEGRWKAVNQAGLMMVGLDSRSAWENRTDRDMAEEHASRSDFFLACLQSDEEAWASGGLFRRVETLDGPDGIPLVLDVTRIPFFEPDASRKGLVVFAVDITGDRKNQEIQEHFSIIFNVANEGIMVTDSAKRIIDVNPAFTRATGYTREDVLGKNPRILSSGQQTPEFYRKMWNSINNDDCWEGEIWNRKKSGEALCEWLSIKRVVKDGKVANYLGIFTDITDRKQSEKIQTHLVRILDESPGEIYTFDARTLRFLSVNAGAAKNLGYSNEEFMEMTPVDIKPLFSRSSFEALIAPLRSGEKQQIVFETAHRRRDGTRYTVEVRLELSDSTTPPVFVGIVQDITLRKENERRIQHLATHDALTDLPNRAVFLDRVEKAVLRGSASRCRYAVGILNLDGFKELNDRLGHQVGDRLLILVARRLESFRETSASLARLGGDEFGILFEDAEDGTELRDFFSGIVRSVAEPFDLLSGSEEPVRISGSLGVTIAPADPGDATALIAHADMALHRVKEQGGNGWEIFDRGMESSRLEQHRIRSEFGRALEQGELCLHYQPKANMKTGEVVGVEALLRWNHPERGLIAPGWFIGVIEKCDLVTPLGLWVLDEALAQQARWESDGLILSVSINIGARQFLSDRFFDDLKERMEKRGRPCHGSLDIEVTEREALHDLAKARDVIDRCREIGVQVHLDDFGTGQASLIALSQLDVSGVKIDMGFVGRMLDSRKDLAIVSSLSVASRMMMIEIVAEGVETEEQGELLIQMGCLIGQGYGIARPMVPEEMPAWVRGWVPFGSWKAGGEEAKEVIPQSTIRTLDHAMQELLATILEEGDAPAALNAGNTAVERCVPCRWLLHGGGARFAGTPFFEELERIHGRFHEIAGEVFIARSRGDQDAMAHIRTLLVETVRDFSWTLRSLGGAVSFSRLKNISAQDGAVPQDRFPAEGREV